MNLKNNAGLTLVENLVAILLVSTLLIGIMGAFFVSSYASPAIGMER
ncbi:MAG: type II secretion system protein [Candidatus Omnitrophica bacterium]|nr:type II secretion system protein [Candidatus Omnitrophota bacterium]